MLYAAKEIWASVQEFMKRVTKVEGDCEKNKRDVEHVANRVDLLEREGKHRDKIIDHQGTQIAKQGEEIKELKSEVHGAKVSAGIWKAKAGKAEKTKRPRKH